jgi:carbon-monoxide dehydrogenase small subunit
MRKINFMVNGACYSEEISPGETLLELLRTRLNMKGPKNGCGAGECGACTVLVSGKRVNSCIYLAAWVKGKHIVTVEGIDENGLLSELQSNFIEEGAIQCGYCTPGMVLSAHSLLEENPNPTKEEIEYEMSGNFCRCTGYKSIISAIIKTANELGKDEKGSV